MDIVFLAKGLIIGFSIAAPVGPIGVLCIRRTLAQGQAFGLISGLGAATADAIYGLIAGFSLTFISSILVSHQLELHLIGGLFLCYLGITTFLSKPADSAATATGKGMMGAYTSTLFLTLTNPLTILSFTAIFAGLGVASYEKNYLNSAALVCGVFLGSALWWLLLSIGVSVFRSKFQQHSLVLVNKISGLIIIAFGIVAIFG